ncbi:copper radical oxidase [Crepidotus variabilis]|uniref:Copper radical oxidase n=1 Tax=Crepidotus variabilis TaxID=179855 RepID=A0A9P6E8Y8_9AGAR|nr:copper radical oxidase [Crepidotus variabilis]
MLLHPLFLYVSIATGSWLVSGASPGKFEDGGNTLISAMMLFLGNEEKVYMLDKAEMNAAQINGHPAWGSVWDIESREATAMDVRTNTFCSSGMHLPNGSYVTFGGNSAVGPGGNLGSQANPGGFTASWDSTIQDFDGTKSIRILNPCKSSDNFNSQACQWFDDPSILSLKKSRWYSAAEATGEGKVIVIGGFVNGGYVNRNYPNIDPVSEGGAAEPTYEYYPAMNGDPQIFQFLVKTSGLNAYAHTYLMPSGKMFVQANLSTVLWDHINNIETPLPDMPKGVARVYPASGATAMLPLTPANNWTSTVLFCGGNDMPEYHYGNYTFPFVNTWDMPASRDCQRITPEPQDGSSAVYEQDDDMLEERTMGQFIILPTGKMLVINGGLNGTAGFSNQGVLTTPMAQMPFGQSLASGPVLTPAIYDPTAPKGHRWSNASLNAATIPRLYHSSAILLPDGSVLVAGSNPNIEVNTTAPFPTVYQAEIFYPPYFKVTNRPSPVGLPSQLNYGGQYFDVLVPSDSYSGSANDAAASAQVTIVRPGFTTHAMNMGQRHLQLNNTYTVDANGSITLHVNQVPPNPNIFQPGPALIFVNIFDIPSKGSYVIVGNGQIGTQPTQPVADLPPSSNTPDATGTGPTNNDGNDNELSSSAIGIIVGCVIGGIALLAMIGAIVGLYLARKRRKQGLLGPPPVKKRKSVVIRSGDYGPMRSTSRGRAATGGVVAGMLPGHGHRRSHHAPLRHASRSEAFVPLRQEEQNPVQEWQGPWIEVETPRPSGETYLGQPMMQVHSGSSPAGGRGHRQF